MVHKIPSDPDFIKMQNAYNKLFGDTKNIKGSQYILFLFIVILDLLTKSYFSARTVVIIPNFLSLTPVTNTGSAFGLFQWLPNTVYIALSMIVIIGVAMMGGFMSRKNSLFVPYLTTFFVAGIAGNLWDRLLFGYVRDFITFSFWPSFNVADSVMVVSVVLFLWYEFQRK